MAETKCPVCGKTFDRTEEWVYKHGLKFYCSWTCLRKDEKPDHRHANKGRAKSFYTFNGETRSVYEWARVLGISYQTFYRRIRAGKPLDDVFKGAKKR